MHNGRYRQTRDQGGVITYDDTRGDSQGKICPLMSIINALQEEATSSPGNCAGKECMFWRAFDKPQDMGYCGLAGIPND